MHTTKVAHTKARAAYVQALEQIKHDLDWNEPYVDAIYDLTEDLAKQDPDRFDELNQFICSIEDQVDRRHRRWELFAELARAEARLIRAYGLYTKTFEAVPTIITKLFSDECVDLLLSAVALHPDAVEIIYMDDQF